MDYKLYDTRALYARTHEPHNFSAQDNRSMPCAYDAPDAKYECSFVISEDVAKQTANAAVSAYNAKKKHDWLPYKPSSLEQIFKRETDVNGVETGNFIIKTVKKTYGEKGNAPKVWMSDGKEVPEGFRITNGSECHALLYLAPWNYAGKSGVQFRLKGIKVNLLADAPVMDDPFKDDPNAKPVVNGSIDDELDSLMDDIAMKKAPTADINFNDEIPF